MPDSTLNAIRLMVRRITQAPQESQLTTAQLDEYINTFLLYDFPQNLRLFGLRTNVTFYTQPYVDTYFTNTTDQTDPLYNFKNRYTAVHDPVYIAGIQRPYTQDRNVFYRYAPKTNSIQDTLLRGTGSTGPFAGTLTGFPVLQNNILLRLIILQALQWFL